MGLRDLAAVTSLVALALSAGCGGRSAQAPPTTPQQVSELEEQTRSDQRKIDELEHELSMLKLRVVEAEAQRVPELPVEVLAPEPAWDDPVAGEDGPMQVVGVDSDGVEIVYVGDAARPGSVQPRAPVRPEPRRRSAPPRRSTASASTSTPTIAHQMREVPDEVPAAPSERLAVTERVGPKVSAHVRTSPAGESARSAHTGGHAAATPPPAAARPAPPRVQRRARSIAPPARPSDAAAAPSAEVKALYGRHLDALRAGDHEGAAAGFRALIEAYPGHDLADNAQYWLGESMYDRKRYREALVEFRKVLDEHPRGNKVPDALLKIGFCHAALGERALAREALERVIERFPNSRPAALASQRLEGLAQ
ncbi:tol-pal system protein YbgF [Haliangium sp.]|uniref:tol-pal system protein YbgF n=1 Tax=Haliangium sp. TaxID=2663208 RepID=UPI003D0E300D